MRVLVAGAVAVPLSSYVMASRNFNFVIISSSAVTMEAYRAYRDVVAPARGMDAAPPFR